MENLKFGTILIGWNYYGCTFPLFYMVIKTTAKTAKAVRVRSIMIDGDGQRGNVVTDGSVYWDERACNIRMGKYGLCTGSGYSYHSLKVWDGKPVFADYCD